MDGIAATRTLDDREALAALLARHPSIRHVDGVFFDLCCRPRGIRVPVRSALADGMAHGFSRSSPVHDATGSSVAPLGIGEADGDPDALARPVPESLAPRHFAEGAEPRAARVLLRFDPGPDGRILDPRAVLERMVALAGARGLRPVAAFEVEFYLIDQRPGPDGAPRPARNRLSGEPEGRTGDQCLQALDDFAPFMDDLLRMAELQGLPITGLNAEAAPGQFEANLRHGDAVAAADHAALLRLLIAETATAHGYRASFMSKPFPDWAGSGLHLHVSLAGRDGANIFDEAGEGPGPLLRQAVGGLLATMPEAMAVFAPNINAYRRLAAGGFVAGAASWGVDNRSVAVRVPSAGGAARRLEHRVAGADANPYLVLAAVLGGMLHGLEAAADPGAPAAGAAQPGQGLPLPSSLEAALAAGAAATTLPALIGPDYWAVYLAAKRAEYDRFAAVPSPREFAWYL
ncbi:MAG TPA: glutamine synthetase family protein [Alphaproteobacteria bacterium]|nr:glutamine synthetase family protein [Alphaproteobacteria bacterium]